MNINRVELLNVLKKAMPGIDKGSSTLEGADTFIFHEGWIHTFNDNISISVPFPITNKAGESISGILKAKEFYDLLNRYQDETIKLIPKNDMWIIQNKNSTAELTLLENNLIERIQGIKPSKLKWNAVPELFIEGISICKFSSNRSSISGIFIKDTIIYSTDEIRVNKFTLDISIDNCFWINDSAASELIKLNNPKKFSISESWVHFKTEEGSVFSCKRLAQDKYPITQIETLVEKHSYEKGDVSNTLPAALLDAVNRASAFSINLESFETVKLTFTNDGIDIYSKRTSGKYTEKVEWEKPLKKEIKPISIYIDYSMIENGLKYSNSFYLKSIKVKDKDVTRIIFKNKNGIQLITTFSGGEE
jgi:hypothetical protein